MSAPETEARFITDWNETDELTYTREPDGVRLTFYVDVRDRRMVEAVVREQSHLAEIRERHSDGKTILVPPSRLEPEIRDALGFWGTHPSIHLAALTLAEHVVQWPPTKENDDQAVHE